MAIKFADRMDNLKASEIRELLKFAADPSIISFGGGMPAPELFPVEEMKKVAVAVLEESGQSALQYATTEGNVKLREQIADRMNRKYQSKVALDDVLITSGSQQGLDFAGKIFINEGDVVLCESPSYLGAINAFKAYGPKFIEVPTDDHGMVIEELEKILDSTENVKMVYVIPDFQNPSGKTWTMERRERFMEVINKHEIPVIEDNPYGELRFEGEILPSLKSMDTKDLVVFLGTYSKIFAPGLRIGWVCAAPEILQKFNFVKQSADLQSSTISQMEAAKFGEMYDLDAHVEKIKAVYKVRRDLMMKIMKEEFPEGVKWTYPEGGLFTWVVLPEHINARDLLKKCLEEKVAFVPGGAFFPNGGNENTFRLNYSNAPEEKLEEGMKRLAKAIKSMM
ncbi:2-aminoadipate transaminase [Peptoclostridium litorale DSM 5388]|uniref:2-aminoadipate transaminase LysN n=1 Tax=Peptoclostridium litorale DSM 5388 TaxID=1121324 RepID=A0A069RJP1_PEPLI|nr:PLP-dependent aminotransferase family protein [Peptoclostridium litorale]KDR96365.1 2-aminoadipate transaminase LysN [Peptoclostridium litorale DSM 5388]SIO27049.1 2-aminoadipate transaminase [Peptoclostridium litorale DSM 5388]